MGRNSPRFERREAEGRLSAGAAPSSGKINVVSTQGADRVVVAAGLITLTWAAFHLATPLMSGELVVGATTAVLGALGALVIAYVNSFLKEQYVRHLDGAAAAAGLAGELASYAASWPTVKAALDMYLMAVDTGKRNLLTFRPFDRPKDVFYEANAGKLGLLGSHLAQDIAYVYGNIGGFRVGFGLLQTHGAEMEDTEFRIRVQTTRAALDRAVERGEPLLEALQQRAVAGFWSTLLAPRQPAATLGRVTKS